MPDDSLTPVCNRCDVAVQIDDRNEDGSRVHCPVCGADFGTWGDVRAKMEEREHDTFKDRDSWRTLRR